MPKFTKLFDPGKSAQLRLKTGSSCRPAATHYSSLDGHITDRQANYYGERAKGGAGLIVTEGAGCRKRGKFGRILINEDKYIPGMKNWPMLFTRAERKR